MEGHRHGSDEGKFRGQEEAHGDDLLDRFERFDFEMYDKTDFQVCGRKGYGSPNMTFTPPLDLQRRAEMGESFPHVSEGGHSFNLADSDSRSIEAEVYTRPNGPDPANSNHGSPVPDVFSREWSPKRTCSLNLAHSPETKRARHAQLVLNSSAAEMDTYMMSENSCPASTASIEQRPPTSSEDFYALPMYDGSSIKSDSSSEYSEDEEDDESQPVSTPPVSVCERPYTLLPMIPMMPPIRTRWWVPSGWKCCLCLAPEIGEWLWTYERCTCLHLRCWGCLAVPVRTPCFDHS